MPYDFSNVKILIVEDMQPMLSLTTSLLGMFGFSMVHGAKNVEDGFELFKQHNHDLIITDWLMEPFDGIEMIRLVRMEEKSPNRYVPIILMTGYSDQPRVEIARDTGVTEFLMKPYTARDLYARIVQIIERPRQFVDADEFFGPDRRRRKDFKFIDEDRRGNSDKNMNDFTDPSKDGKSILLDLVEKTKKI